MSSLEKAAWFGCARRRQVLLPTWRGYLVVILAIAILGMASLFRIHGFLALNARQTASVLVVEGWTSVFTMQLAINEFQSNHYRKIYVTGGPLLQGTPLSEYRTYAEMGAATLIKMGLSSNVVQAVPAPWVPQDRTYTSALVLAQWFKEHGDRPVAVNLMTDGPHARRSRLMFERALGDAVAVGVISAPPIDYDPARWWCSSQGFRAVTDETIAYLYARLLFRSGKG